MPIIIDLKVPDNINEVEEENAKVEQIHQMIEHSNKVIEKAAEGIKLIQLAGTLPEENETAKEYPYMPLHKPMFSLEMEFMVGIYADHEQYGNIIIKCTHLLKQITDLALSCRILVKRCNGYLHLRCYNRALEDANTILEIQPSNQTAIYYKIKALIGLELHEVALYAIYAFMKMPLYDEGKSNWFIKTKYAVAYELNLGIMHENVKKCVKEKLAGYYDMDPFISCTSVIYLECGNFVNSVKFGFTEAGAGERKWFLTAGKNFSRGDLIIATKPLSVVYSAISNPKDEAARLAFLEPELSVYLRNLYGGPDYNEGPPILKPRDCKKPLRPLSAKEIVPIIRLNGFARNFRPKYTFHSPHDKLSIKSGVWYLPSFLKHSCWNYNCLWTIYGSVMFIRAVRDINEGEILTIPYFDPLSTNYEEKVKFMKEFGIVCDCVICVQNKETLPEVFLRPTKLPKQIQEEDMGTLCSSIIQLEKERNYNQINHIFLVYQYIKLGVTYLRSKRPELAVRMYEKAFQAISSEKSSDILCPSPAEFIGEISIDISLSIIIAYLSMPDYNTPEIKEWLKILKRDAISFFGRNGLQVVRGLIPGIIMELQLKRGIFL